MTVAAIVLVPDVDRALSDADGEPAIRRVAQAAWAGGALPIVVVSAGARDAGDTAPDAGDPRLRDALGDDTVILTHPSPETPPGAAWFAHGLAVAAEAVTETAAGLLWPFRYAWVDPETVTSLVEGHGATPEAIVRPAYDARAGFPILVPLTLGSGFAAHPEIHGWQAIEAAVAAGAPFRLVELGDPGIVEDLSTPRSALPPYQGPPEPASGAAAPEWNQTLGEVVADADAARPVEGRALAPYGQARDVTRDDEA